MSVDPQQDGERARFVRLTLLRAAGVVVMLTGLLVWHSDIIRPGGHAPLGSGLFLIGVVASLLLPPILVKRWRTPRP